MLGAILAAACSSGLNRAMGALSAVDNAFAAAGASISVYADGTITQTLVADLGGGSGESLIENWWIPTVPGVGANFWVRLTGSGDSPGTLNTWQQLSTTRAWSLTQGPASGSKSFSGTLEIALDSGGSTVVISVAFYLEASVGA